MRATRAVGPEALRDIVARHRDAMVARGTTTFEGKSGYGLDRETELAQLEAVADAGGVPTWLGAHAVPPEHRDADSYVDWAIAEVLPASAELAVAADVFVERGAFGIDPARRYLHACAAAGLALRLHGDQLSEMGAVPLALELGARSVDHLESTGPEGVAALGRSDVAAVLLPVAALYLDRPMPPARALVDAGAVVALATDFNPGSAFCESLPVVATLACTQLGLSPAEALGAMTVNAAHVLGLADRGRLEAGLRADIVLLDATDWRHVAYHLAGDVVHSVVRDGRIVVSRA
jgi:imidazolonepropionase